MTVETALFAGGCFWCLQPPFDKLEGVTKTIVGYAGGTSDNPTYEEVCHDKSPDGHREVIQVQFDPAKISYEQIVRTFFINIDPTDAGGQFADRGRSYTTSVYVEGEAQRAAAERVVAELAQELGERIVTTVEAAPRFWPAEDYHQDYYEKAPLRYNMYKHGSGRPTKLAAIWGDKASEDAA